MYEPTASQQRSLDNAMRDYHRSSAVHDLVRYGNHSDIRWLVDGLVSGAIAARTISGERKFSDDDIWKALIAGLEHFRSYE